MAALQPMTPLALERVVKKCLAKDPDERWQSAKDLSSELSWIGESRGDTAGLVPLPAGRKTREALAWLLACVSAVAMISWLIWQRSSKPLQESMYFHAPLPFPARDVALAPNGHTVAMVAYSESARKNVIWIYEPGSSGARILPDTEAATYPFWSADGQSFAFFADGRLKRLELSSGQIHTICDAPSGRGGTWNKDGVIVFAPKAAGGLYRGSASGGTAMLISDPDKTRGEQSQR
jgi:eukaryotic-like serine/threonine-protein kinase